MTMSCCCCDWFKRKTPNQGQKQKPKKRPEKQQLLWHRFVDALCRQCRRLWRRRRGAPSAQRLAAEAFTAIPQPTIDPSLVVGPESLTATTAEWPESRALANWEATIRSNAAAEPGAVVSETTTMREAEAAADYGHTVQRVGSSAQMPSRRTLDTPASTELGVEVPASDDSLHTIERQRLRSQSSRHRRTPPGSEGNSALSTVPTQRDDGLYESFELAKPKPEQPTPPQIVASPTPSCAAAGTTSISMTKDWGDYDKKRVDYDAVYNMYSSKEQEDNQYSARRSVVLHILSQLAIGMDLSRVTLPTFILERRSLLEMYADFFAHSDDFVDAANQDTPEKRFLAMVKYYLNSFYPARKSALATKPYNPVLGETFRCRWTLPGSPPTTNVYRTQGGPFPGSAINQLTFIAEQVSHHPPVSAFYAEHPAADVSCTAHIYTKSSFLGLSIGVNMIGSATVKMHKHNEDYMFTFPRAYGRAIVTTPWIELGGKVDIRCDATHYRADIEFLTKPLLGGSAHHIEGRIYRDQQPLWALKGQWNGKIYVRSEGIAGDGTSQQGPYELFTDVRQKPEVPKECVPVMQQEDLESRKLWRHVTTALYERNEELATKAKLWVEQRQRDKEAKRTMHGEQWRARFFEHFAARDGGDAWRYRQALELRRQNG